MQRSKVSDKTAGGEALPHAADAMTAMNASPLLPSEPLSTFSSSSVASFTHAHRQQIGERVHAARLAARLTQTELAGQEYSKSYISAVERGKLTPSFHALGLLAERLGVTRSYLLGEDLLAPNSSIPDLPGTEDQQTGVREALEQLLGQARYTEAITLCGEYGRLDWMCEVRAAYAQCLAAQGRYEDAYQHLVLAGQEFSER